MINRKRAEQNPQEKLVHREERSEWEEFKVSKNFTGDDGGYNEPTIKHINYFKDAGELYIAGWRIFEDIFIHWTNKEFQSIANHLQTEQKNLK